MIYDVVLLASDIIKPERNYTTDILLQWLKIKLKHNRNTRLVNIYSTKWL